LPQLNYLLESMNSQNLNPGEATQKARLDYAAERLRLLYVGITRARKDLIITWNTGRRGDRSEAAPITALRTRALDRRETDA
ncbi:MAG: 3'-5' exonuclease, partial [Anaerolineales bacterium]